MSKNSVSFVYFGTPEFSVTVLEALEARGYIPSLIVTQEDKPQGRHLLITPPEVKVWANARGIEVFQPKTLKDESVYSKLSSLNSQLFIVAAYGKLIPNTILDIPTHKTLNIHPSLLPIHRGPSPIQEAILKDSGTGVSIIRLDEAMDHGPIVAQRSADIPDWPPYRYELEHTLAKLSGELLADTIPGWIDGTISEVEQDHNEATFTKKIEKEDGHISLEDDADTNNRKVRAYCGWPKAFAYFEKADERIRAIITRSHIENGEFVIEKVIPEGKKEIAFEDFKHSLS